MRTRESIVWHWDVSRRARMTFWFARAFVKPLFTIWPTTDRGIELLATLDELIDRLPKPKGLDIEAISLGGVPCEKITNPRPTVTSMDGARL